MKKSIMLTAIVAISAATFSAFKTPPAGYQVGDKASDFNLKNIDGKMVSLSGMKNNKGAIVIFTCNHCPFSQAYEDRIIKLHRKYEAQGYPVIAINPNDDVKVPDDSYENMVKRAKEKKFGFPYLRDADQKVAMAYGAARTPHVYILNRDGDGYKVAYIGAIDNNTDDEKAVTQKYVETAVDELLAGKAVTTTTTKAIGCTIKWKS
jgi:peroxiredoxin